MTKASLGNIGQLVRTKRANQGIREAAQEIGVSPATLSRIETGKLPDLQTFSKLCLWLRLNPADVLGYQTGTDTGNVRHASMAVHLRAERNLKPETANALSQMILVAREMILDSAENG